MAPRSDTYSKLLRPTDEESSSGNPQLTLLHRLGTLTDDECSRGTLNPPPPDGRLIFLCPPALIVTALPPSLPERGTHLSCPTGPRWGRGVEGPPRRELRPGHGGGAPGQRGAPGKRRRAT